MDTLQEVEFLRAKAQSAQAASAKAAAMAEQWAAKEAELDEMIAKQGLTWEQVPGEIEKLQAEADAALEKARKAMDGVA